MWPQCLKLRNQHVAAVREDNSEEIVKAIKENLEEDAKDNASEEEEIPLKEEENQNKGFRGDVLVGWDQVQNKLHSVYQ